VNFEIAYAIEILPAVLAGAAITVLATIGGMAVAIVVGLVLAIARMSPFRPLALLTHAFVEFVRLTPLLIQLYFLYYVLPIYGIVLNGLTTGIIGLGLHYSTYLAEVYRAGIESVPRGQWEAAVAVGFSRARTWRSVILPQAIPRVIPPLGNYLVGMFKSTPYLATITVPEMLAIALEKAGLSFRYFEPIGLVGLIFVAVSYPSALFVRALEVRFGRS